MYTEKDVLDTLLQKIFYVLASPDAVTNVRTERAFFSVCMPGIPLSAQTLDFGFTTMSPDQIERAADFSSFVNVVPLWGQSWRPSGRTLTGEYKKVLQSPVLPQTQLSDAEKKQYQEAHDLLWTKSKIQNPLTGEITEIETPSIWQQRYDEYAKYHELALTDYLNRQIEYINHMSEPGYAEKWAQLKPILEGNVRNALKKWEAAGKRKVEEAWGTIGNLDGRGLNASWQDRRTRFDQYKKGAQVGDFWLTKYYPNKFWEADAGWFDIRLSHKEVHTVDEKEEMNWGGGGGFNLGLWKASKEVSYESKKTNYSSDTSGIEVGFQLAMIPFLRGWLDADVFESRSWDFDWQTVSKSEILSDGQIPPHGTMPMYPTAMVLARNVKISFNKTSEVNKTVMETIKASGSVGWGPFSVRGNYYKRWDKSTHDFVEDSAGITIPGMQVIGFICRLLEKSPNPDPDLNWGNPKP